jgi:hypothetical protein
LLLCQEYFPAEVDKLRQDVSAGGLSVVVLADWYSVKVMREVRFWDENTASWWTPETGGSNVPALNELLAPFGIALSEHVVKGKVNVTNAVVPFASGSTIARFPAGGHLLQATLQDAGSGAPTRRYPVLGLYQLPDNASVAADGNGTAGGAAGRSSGRIAVWGDSNCFDLNNNHNGFCTHLLEELMAFAAPQTAPPAASEPLLASCELLQAAFLDPTVPVLPQRMVGNQLHRYSRVISASPQSGCASDAFSQRLRPRPVRWDRRRGGQRQATELSPEQQQLTATQLQRLRRRMGQWSEDNSSLPAVDHNGELRLPLTELLQSDRSGGDPSPPLQSRHQFRTALTSALLLLCLLLCVLLPASLLLLFHVYGTDSGKRSYDSEEQRHDGLGRRSKTAGGSCGQTLWLWTLRTAPSLCISALRVTHAALLSAPPPPTPSASAAAGAGATEPGRLREAEQSRSRGRREREADALASAAAAAAGGVSVSH